MSVLQHNGPIPVERTQCASKKDFFAAYARMLRRDKRRMAGVALLVMAAMLLSCALPLAYVAHVTTGNPVVITEAY